MKTQNLILRMLTVAVFLLFSASLLAQDSGGKWDKWKWGVGIRPAYNLYSLGDFKDAKDSFMDKANDNMGDPSVKSFGGSMTAQVTAFGIYKLKENLDVGFSLGYWHLGGGTYQFKRNFSEVGKAIYASSISTYSYGLSAFAIPFELFAMTPVSFMGTTLMARFALGLMYVSGSIDYKNSYQYDSSDYTSHGTLKDSQLGSNFSAGLEYQCTDCLFLKFIMGFMCAKLDGFEGDVVNDSGSKQRQSLAVWDDDYGFSVGTTDADDPCTGSRPAVVALSGMYFMLGAQWYFDCCF
ncbi:hypothetical protein KAR48_09320 [bacterium]|nr:hypothetical protein [bacterium]